jgi:excisionase family DNA binding protein
MNPNTYSLAEAAELVGRSTRTLRRAIDAEELLAARQASGSIRISRAELAKWWRLRGGGDLFGPSTPLERSSAPRSLGFEAPADFIEAIRIVVREELDRAKGS